MGEGRAAFGIRVGREGGGMNNVAEHAIPCSTTRLPVRRAVATPAKRGVRCSDARWPEVAAALAELRAARRCSVRIVDADCGTGALLLCAVCHARALGFTAIEALGLDDAPTLVERARAAAAIVHDPAIGITFETTDLVDALGEESDFPADIVMWHDCQGCDVAVAQAVAAAGHTLIGDPAEPAGVQA